MYKEYNDMGEIAEARQTTIKETYRSFMIKRELSKAQRIASRQKRLSVEMNGFKSYYEA